MNRKFNSCLALALVLAAGTLSLSSQQAHAAAAGLITPAILGGLNQTVSTGGSTGYTAGARLGFGLAIFEADVSAMFLSRGFSLGTTSTSFKYIQIPVMLRYSLLPMISIGVGGYYDIALTDGASEVYGARGALKVSPPALPLFAEVNYSYNFGPGDSGSINDVQVLAGFKF